MGSLYVKEFTVVDRIMTFRKWHKTLPQYRVLVFVISLLGLVVPIFDARPIFIMILSQTFNAFILPATVLCIFYLTNNSKLMGKHKNGMFANICLSIILLFSLLTSWISVEGLIETFTA